MFTVGQIFGAIGIVINFLIFQQPNKKKLIFIKLISDVVWAVHYGLLGAFSGMIVALLCIPRELVFFNRGKKFADSIVWLFVFGAVNIGSAIFTWNGVFSILPASSSVLAMIAFWQKNIKCTKTISVAVSCLMATYDITAQSYTGIVNEIITLISIGLSFIHLYKNEKNLKRDKK